MDLRDHPLPFFDGDAPTRTGRDYADEAVTRFSRVIDRADGYVILTAEYNHGYPAVLKNALDSTFVEWRRKPVAYVGWGNTGGARGDRAAAGGGGRVRDGTAAPRRARAARRAHRALRQAPDPADLSLFAPLEPRLDMLADDLAWWMRAARVGAGRRRVDRRHGESRRRAARLSRSIARARRWAGRHPTRLAVLLRRLVDRPGAVASRLGCRHFAPGPAGRPWRAPPTPDDFNQSVWDEWNAKSPRAQADDALVADEALIQALEAVDEAERARLTFSLGPLQPRLQRHVRPAAQRACLPHLGHRRHASTTRPRLPEDATALVVDNLSLIARFSGRPDGQDRTIAVRTTDPERDVALRLSADGVELGPGEPGQAPDLELPAEALCRLVYGRLDPDHTPGLHRRRRAARHAARRLPRPVGRPGLRPAAPPRQGAPGAARRRRGAPGTRCGVPRRGAPEGS